MQSLIGQSCLGSLVAIALTVGAAANAQPLQKLRVGYLKVGHLSPMLLVKDEMKTCGVDAQLTEFVRYADSRTALLSDSVDVSAIGPADLLISLAQGSDKIIGLTGVASSPKYLVVKKGVKIDGWDDIKGKRIGIAPGSAVWFQWAATMAEKGIPYNSFTAVNIQGGGTAFVQSLKRGDVDAVALWEPYESQVVEEGDAYFAKNVEYDKSRAVGNELGLLAASKNSMTNNRDAVKCFLSSYEKAQDKLARDPEFFAATYSKFTGLPLTITGPSVRVIKLGASLDLAQLQRQAKEFHKLGVIQKDVSDKVAGAWDQTLIKEVRSTK